MLAWVHTRTITNAHTIILCTHIDYSQLTPLESQLHSLAKFLFTRT